MSDRLMPRQIPTGGIAGRLSGRLFELADQVRRPDPRRRRDPEQFWRDKGDLTAKLVDLAREAERRLAD